MNLQDVSHIHIPDGDVRMIHDSDNRLLWGAVGYNVLFSGNTFQQSYEGKNMFNKANPPSTLLDASASELETGLRITQTAAGQWKGCIFVLGKASDVAGQTINVHAIATKSAFNLPYCQISLCNASGGDRIRVVNFNRPEIDIAATMPDNPSREYYCLSLLSNGSGTGNRGDYIDYEELMIYLGSTATSYEPYVGGQPSPSPDYPQDINVVTGTQTISINGTNYPIDLGSIELCKLGAYQDYIWKDGDDWKVHKAIRVRQLTGSQEEEWLLGDMQYCTRYNLRGFNDSITSPSESVISPAYCTHFTNVTPTQNWATMIGNSNFSLVQDTKVYRFTLGEAKGTGNLDNFISWLQVNAVILYYVLATPTDTVITDTTLIAQLEAIYNLVRRYGYNFVVSASGNNLPIIIDRTLL